VSKNKTEFFLDHLLLFFVSFEKKAQKKRTQKKDRREQNFTLLKKGQNSSFSRCAQEREFCLKPLRKGEKANKNTKDLHHLKSLCRFLSFSLRSEYYCSYSSLILLIEERLERESIYARVIDCVF